MSKDEGRLTERALSPTIEGSNGRPAGTPIGVEVPEDARLTIVRQVLASRTFAKSVRLSHFLEFVCRKTLEGRLDEINEQQIGIHVFGRSAAYNARTTAL